MHLHDVEHVASVRPALVLLGHAHETIARGKVRLVLRGKARRAPPGRGQIDAIAKNEIRVDAGGRCR